MNSHFRNDSDYIIHYKAHMGIIGPGLLVTVGMMGR